MNRIIKFKAKRLDNGEWVKGDLLHKGNKTYIYNPRINDKGFYMENEEVDPNTVCQYTGLKDIIGREIWEHDLVKFHGVIREVIFQNGAFSLEGCALYKTDIGKAEIVGNRFDRKENEK